MSKYITASFIDNDGIPSAELSPTVTIKKIDDDSIVINAAAMLNMGDGDYKYLFTAHDPAVSYTYTCDAGPSISNRYSKGDSSAEIALDAVWDADITDHVVNGTFGDLIQDSFKGIGL